MSGADYQGGCPHQAGTPCAMCAAARAKFDDLFRSLPGWPRGSRAAGACEPFTRTDPANTPDAPPTSLSSLPAFPKERHMADLAHTGCAEGCSHPEHRPIPAEERVRG